MAPALVTLPRMEGRELRVVIEGVSAGAVGRTMVVATGPRGASKTSVEGCLTAARVAVKAAVVGVMGVGVATAVGEMKIAGLWVEAVVVLTVPMPRSTMVETAECVVVMLTAVKGAEGLHVWFKFRKQ